MIGQTIGPYQVLSKLGEGGMGEVYRATDTNLKRPVALKALPAAVSADADRLARFQREAEVLATLNHPHIAQIYGLEKTPDATALVMELVEGEDLAARIARGPIPPDEALAMARQIADALEAAHEQGIVHRDLKPANIMLRADGTVKVLDFGLAKALERPGGTRQHDAANSPTITSPALTAAGLILGTAAYMSPEQAKGKAVDKRADIWAFGCVLYELLTGTRAFGGDDITDTLTAIMRDAPDVSALPPATPVAIRQLIARCLEKDARVRLRDIGEARVVLDVRALASPAAVEPSTPRPPRARLAWAVAAVATLVAAATTALWLRPRPETAAAQIRFEIDSSRFFLVNGPPQALSPDGRRLAFSSPAAPSTPPRLWVRALDAAEAVALPGTEGAADPFWSPDGSSIAFFADGKLKRVAASGGPVQSLCDADTSDGGSWSTDNVIVFSGPKGLLRVSAAGGVPTPLTTLDQSLGELSHRWPFFLPGGRILVYLRIGAAEKAIYAASLDGTTDKRLLTSDSKAEYSAGHLVFVRGGVLTAVPFDVGQLATTGDGMPLAEDLGLTATTGFAAFAVSESGVLSYRTSTVSDSQLTWYDRGGRPLRMLGEPGPIVQLSLSRDDRRVAVQHTRGQILLYDERGAATRFASAASGPVWSPDGRELIYFSPVGGANEVFRRLVSSNEGKEILAGIGSPIPEDWSRDGRHLVYVEPAAGVPGLFVVPLDGGPPQRLHGSDEPQFSPDNRWLLYQSNESGASQIHVQPWPGPGEHTRLTIDGGRQPKWRADGKELYYLKPDGMLTALTIRLGERVETDEPRPLFQTRLLPSTAYDQYAVSADGQRFLVATPVNQSQTPLTLVVNWPASLAANRQ